MRHTRCYSARGILPLNHTIRPSASAHTCIAQLTGRWRDTSSPDPSLQTHAVSNQDPSVYAAQLKGCYTSSLSHASWTLLYVDVSKGFARHFSRHGAVRSKETKPVQKVTPRDYGWCTTRPRLYHELSVSYEPPTEERVLVFSIQSSSRALRSSCIVRGTSLGTCSSCSQPVSQPYASRPLPPQTHVLRRRRTTLAEYLPIGCFERFQYHIVPSPVIVPKSDCACNFSCPSVARLLQ